MWMNGCMFYVFLRGQNFWFEVCIACINVCKWAYVKYQQCFHESKCCSGWKSALWTKQITICSTSQYTNHASACVITACVYVWKWMWKCACLHIRMCKCPSTSLFVHVASSTEIFQLGCKNCLHLHISMKMHKVINVDVLKFDWWNRYYTCQQCVIDTPFNNLQMMWNYENYSTLHEYFKIMTQ